MGLKELSVSDLKKNKKVLKCLEFYGITEKHLRYMKAMPTMVSSLQTILAYLRNKQANVNDLQTRIDELNEEIEGINDYDSEF